GPWAAVAPQPDPTPHGQRGLHPFHLCGTPVGMRLIPLHPLHRQVWHALPVVRRRSLGRHPLATLDGLERHGTDVGSPLITDAPPLTLHQPYDRVFRELAASQQGALPCRALSVAYRTAQPFAGLVYPGPRPMCAMAFAGTMEPYTWWMRAREASISLWR